MPASSIGFLHYKLESKLGLVVTPGWRALSSAGLAWCLAVIGCLILVGAVLLAFRGEWFLPLYFVLSLGLIVLTLWSSQFVRYLGESSTLTWITANNPITAIIDNGIGSVNPAGRSTSVSPTTTTTYTLSVTNTGQQHLLRASNRQSGGPGYVVPIKATPAAPVVRRSSVRGPPRRYAR